MQVDSKIACVHLEHPRTPLLLAAWLQEQSELCAPKYGSVTVWTLHYTQRLREAFCPPQKPLEWSVASQSSLRALSNSFLSFSIYQLHSSQANCDSGVKRSPILVDSWTCHKVHGKGTEQLWQLLRMEANARCNRVVRNLAS